MGEGYPAKFLVSSPSAGKLKNQGGDEVDDSEIVRLFSERNEDAIAAVSDKYKSYCFAIAMNILSSREDAEECVNDTLQKAWEMIPPHKPETLSTFLGRITRNIAIDRHRQSLAEKRGGGEAAVAFDELAEIISGGTDIENETERKELLSEINSFLGKLPKLKREIFMCRYWYYDSIHDIASQYGLSESNVSVILNRTRQKLKEHLTGKGY